LRQRFWIRSRLRVVLDYAIDRLIEKITCKIIYLDAPRELILVPVDLFDR